MMIVFFSSSNQIQGWEPCHQLDLRIAIPKWCGKADIPRCDNRYNWGLLYMMVMVMVVRMTIDGGDGDGENDVEITDCGDEK